MCVKCDNCGAEIGLDGVCKFCGTVLSPREPVFSIPQPRVPVQQPVQAASPKSRWVAILLWLLLGYLGAHQFYAGKVGMGILYLFTFGLCGIGWVIDGVSLFAGSFRDRYGLPIRV